MIARLFVHTILLTVCFAQQGPADLVGADAAAAEFVKLFRQLDTDQDGVVLLSDVFKALGLERAEARVVKRTRALDRNGDGKITEAEGVTAVRAEIEYQTNRGMNTDADGDGALTPQEYALSVPDPDNHADETGLTATQWRGFRILDKDQSQKIERREAESNAAVGYLSSYWVQRMSLRMKIVDRNRDNSLDALEWAALTDISVADARQQLDAAGAVDGKIGLREASTLLFRVPPKSRSMVEAKLQVIENETKKESPKSNEN